MPETLQLLLPRCFAYIVDALIIFFAMRAVPDSMYVHSELATRFIVSVLYFSATEIFMAGTLGKLLVGLRVTDDDGDDAGFINIIIRNVLKFIGIYFYFVNYATVPFFGRAIHDMIAHTDIEEDSEYDED